MSEGKAESGGNSFPCFRGTGSGLTFEISIQSEAVIAEDCAWGWVESIVYRQFACTYLCTRTRTARRGYQTSCYSQLQPVLSLQVVLGPNMDPTEEQHVFLITGPSLSTRILAFNVRKCGCLLTITTF